MRDINILKTNGVDVEKGLELLGDMSMYDSILNDFLTGFLDRMKSIENYKKMMDMANYAIAVHSLKSDSKYLGFMALADIAYRHEMASKANDLSSVNLHYQELVDEANRIYNVARSYMQKDEVKVETVSINNNPAVDAPPKVEIVTPEEVVQGTKAILVADDSNIIRDFIQEIFASKYEVLMAKNGKEVLNIIAANPQKIAALLLDLNMPDMNGFEVLDYFKNNSLFEQIPVSIISGVNDKASIERAFSYPIVDMLNKPFNMDNVRLVVEKTINFKSQD